MKKQFVITLIVVFLSLLLIVPAHAKKKKSRKWSAVKSKFSACGEASRELRTASDELAMWMATLVMAYEDGIKKGYTTFTGSGRKKGYAKTLRQKKDKVNAAFQKYKRACKAATQYYADDIVVE